MVTHMASVTPYYHLRDKREEGATHVDFSIDTCASSHKFAFQNALGELILCAQIYTKNSKRKRKVYRTKCTSVTSYPTSAPTLIRDASIAFTSGLEISAFLRA